MRLPTPLLASVGYALLGAAALSGCATAKLAQPPAPSPVNLPFGDPTRRDREAPLVLDAITDTRSGALLTPGQLAERLRGVSLVFVGETHTSLADHRAQAHLLAALAATGRPVLVGLEMFPRADEVDAALANWVSGALDEQRFLAEAHWYKHWGFAFGYYREVFTTARAHRMPMFGVNAPREVITAVRKKGFDGLTAEERAHVPPKVDTTSDEHRRLFRALIGDDAHGAMPEAALDGMFRAQCTWDAVMAWNAIRARQGRGGDAIMVVLIGSGHAAYALGAARQAATFGVKDAVAVVPVPVRDEKGNPSRIRASYAEYLWTVPPEDPLPPFPTLGVSLSDRPGESNPVVVMVAPGSAAEKAGLKSGDRLLSLDGEAVPGKETFSRLIADKRWGDAVRLTIQRGKETLTLETPLRRKEGEAP